MLLNKITGGLKAAWVRCSDSTLLQRSARSGRCGVSPEDRKRSVRCSRKLRHRPVLYMVQHAGGVNLVPICNRSDQAVRFIKAGADCAGMGSFWQPIASQLRRNRQSDEAHGDPASRGDLPIRAILYAKKSPADEEAGRERTAVLPSV